VHSSGQSAFTKSFQESNFEVSIPKFKPFIFGSMFSLREYGVSFPIIASMIKLNAVHPTNAAVLVIPRADLWARHPAEHAIVRVCAVRTARHKGADKGGETFTCSASELQPVWADGNRTRDQVINVVPLAFGAKTAFWGGPIATVRAMGIGGHGGTRTRNNG